MIQPIDKLIQISGVQDHEKLSFRLDTADGRFNLADRVLADIDEWCQKAFDDGPRAHLGASVIAAECDRHIWYSFRWFKHPQFSGRMQRLFQDGHWYEDRLIQMLVGIGCDFSQVDEATGKQHRISDVNGHFGGSSDGTLILSSRYGDYPRMLAEFKTINDKNFNLFHDVRESKKQHWGQMCVYGFKMGIRYAIYFMVNKNDADLKVEIVELDWELAQRLIQKADWLVNSKVPPAKLSQNVSDYRCKMCDSYRVCQLNQAPDVNCRTCKHSTAIEDKQWRCERWNVNIPGQSEALAGCSGYEVLVY